MKKLIFFFLIFFYLSVSGQQAQVTYSESTENIANPERGWYQHTETYASNYQQLTQQTLVNYRVNSKITLILREFFLDSYVTSQIPTSYLTKMQTDFDRMRAAGIKCIVRFAYSDDPEDNPLDANKTLMLQHINTLAPILNTNKDVISVIQMGFIGAWGEGYYTSNFGTGNLTAQNIADRNEVLTSILTKFPGQIQVRTPKFKMNLTGSSPVNAASAYSDTPLGRIGLHNDAVLNGPDNDGTYQNISLEKSYAKSTGMYTAIGGESNAVVSGFTNCSASVTELNDMSYDYLNRGYHPNVIQGWQNEPIPCHSEITNRLGYRFVLIQSQVVNSSINIILKNTGFGHLYNQRTVYLVYRNVATDVDYMYPITTDARLWLKGNNILLTQMIPNLSDGDYDVFLYLPDSMSDNAAYAVQLANNGTWEGNKGYNDLQIRLHPMGLGVNAVVYNNHININTENYTVQLFDMTGKKVSDKEDMSGLSNGIYIVKIKTQDNIYTLKVVKGD